jgi:hypothetical protein
MMKRVPLTLPQANGCVSLWHRHHAPIPPGFPWFSIGAVSEGMVVAVAICGRPTNRNNDDRQTVELLRLASDGTPNACSFLYGASARTARELGATRIITYTLEEESGSSLRAAGWNRDKDGIQSAWTMGKTRTHAVSRPHMHLPKVRWSVHFRDPVEYTLPELVSDGMEQLSL